EVECDPNIKQKLGPVPAGLAVEQEAAKQGREPSVSRLPGTPGGGAQDGKAALRGGRAIRHEWWQTHSHVVVDIIGDLMIKPGYNEVGSEVGKEVRREGGGGEPNYDSGEKGQPVTALFDHSLVKVRVASPLGYSATFHVAHAVVPSECKAVLTRGRISLRMRKLRPGRWEALERPAAQPQPSAVDGVAHTAAVQPHTPASCGLAAGAGGEACLPNATFSEPAEMRADSPAEPVIASLGSMLADPQLSAESIASSLMSAGAWPLQPSERPAPLYEMADLLGSGGLGGVVGGSEGGECLVCSELLVNATLRGSNEHVEALLAWARQAVPSPTEAPWAALCANGVGGEGVRGEGEGGDSVGGELVGGEGEGGERVRGVVGRKGRGAVVVGEKRKEGKGVGVQVVGSGLDVDEEARSKPADRPPTDHGSSPTVSRPLVNPPSVAAKQREGRRKPAAAAAPPQELFPPPLRCVCSPQSTPVAGRVR
ncbi:MAG: hypothetical protein SGPRY_001654, partial [Prymnesium sp.]